jgi:[citrate (pro-3S)-lyase] ligase
MTSATQLTFSRDLQEARRLIESQDLLFEENCDDLVGVFENGRLIATAGRAGFVFKMITILPEQQGGEILGALLTELIRLGRAAGHDVFWIFTRPESMSSFLPFGFRLLVTGGKAALLESGGGFEQWLAEHVGRVRPGRNGACVLNANPFTLGHLYLVEQASRRVDTLYAFLVREDLSVFPYAVRRRLADRATAHLCNVIVLDTSRYAISAGTFPSYFLKRLDQVALEQMRIDLHLFGHRIAPAFHIQARFVGTEPYDPTTDAYNDVMREVLPAYGIELTELPRTSGVERGREEFISAAKVRAALARRDFEKLRCWVPHTTLEFLQSKDGLAVADRIAAETRLASGGGHGAPPSL